MRSAPPERSSRLLAGGRIVLVYRVTREAVKSRRSDASLADVEAMEGMADWALRELDRVRLSHWARHMRWLHAR